MMKKYFFLLFPFLLSGCIGSWISGHTGYIHEDYPDIRTVPEREIACEDRGLHEEGEKASRTTDFKSLEEDREKIKARDQALRERAFPNVQPDDGK